MIAVVDNDALQNLILTRNAELLPKMFDKVYIPTQVVNELKAGNDPKLEDIRRWANNLPAWVEEKDVKVDPTLSPDKFGVGERAAITLAEELKRRQPEPVVIVMDDRRAKEEARDRGNSAVGTLGLAQEGHHRGFTSYQRTVDDLVVHTKAYITEKVIDDAQRNFERGVRPLALQKLLIDNGIPVDPFKEGFKAYEVVTRGQLGISEKASPKDVVELAAMQGVKAIVTRDHDIEVAAERSPHQMGSLTIAGARAGDENALRKAIDENVLQKAMNDIRREVEKRQPEPPPLPPPTVSHGRSM